MVFYPKLKKKNKHKKRRNIDLVKINQTNHEFEVKFDFDKSSKAWGRNKRKIFSQNGFCIGYEYKH